MAANIEVYKRKIELGDITNKQKMAKHDKCAYFGVQERLPLPQTPSCLLLPHKPRQKLVSFDTSRNQQYENSPLLTPKEDDDYESESEGLTAQQQLDGNPDYLALCLTRRLLDGVKNDIQHDLEELASIRARANTASKLDLVEFYVLLILPKDGSTLPSQRLVVRAPEVLWSKYHPGLTNVTLHDDETNNNEKPLFRRLSVFGNLH